MLKRTRRGLSACLKAVSSNGYVYVPLADAARLSGKFNVDDNLIPDVEREEWLKVSTKSNFGLLALREPRLFI